VTTGPSPGQTWPIVWSPDGSKLAFIAGDIPVASDVANAQVYVANADGSNIEQAISGLENLDDVSVTHGLAWVPGSRDQIVYYGPQGAFLTSTKGGQDRLLDDDACCAAEPSPDGKQILFVEYSNGAISVAPIGGGPKKKLTQVEG
jgi:Tol biopolymer transport system component